MALRKCSSSAGTLLDHLLRTSPPTRSGHFSKGPSPVRFSGGMTSHSGALYGARPTTLEALPTIEDTQRLLGGVSRRTVLRELDAGELIRVRVRGRVLVDPDSIRRYIERHREPV